MKQPSKKVEALRKRWSSGRLVVQVVVGPERGFGRRRVAELCIDDAGNVETKLLGDTALTGLALSAVAALAERASETSAFPEIPAEEVLNERQEDSE